MKFIKRLFINLAILVFLFYAVLFGTMWYQTSRDPVMYLDDREVQSVLTWLDQPAETVELVNSYRPPASWAGDYEKIFALKVSARVISHAIEKPTVIRGDIVPDDLREAVHFAMAFTHSLPWFPAEKEILSPSTYVALFRVVISGGYPDAVDLVVINPEKQIVYFVAGKM